MKHKYENMLARAEHSISHSENLSRFADSSSNILYWKMRKNIVEEVLVDIDNAVTYIEHLSEPDGFEGWSDEARNGYLTACGSIKAKLLGELRTGTKWDD